MSPTPGVRRALARDERGAVLLVGIFAAVFLFGAAWFVLGTGDAIEHRETMQDAADSGAQSVAVLHARAMNMVALLNLTKLTVAATVTSALAAVVGASKTIAWIKSSPALLAALGAALPLLAAVAGQGHGRPRVDPRRRRHGDPRGRPGAGDAAHPPARARRRPGRPHRRRVRPAGPARIRRGHARCRSSAASRSSCASAPCPWRGRPRCPASTRSARSRRASTRASRPRPPSCPAA